MGYVGGELADLAPTLERGVRRFAQSAADAEGEELRKRMRRHTPVAKPGAPEIVASYGSSGAWIRARGGRRPGTLRENFEAPGAELRSRNHYYAPVTNDDPVFDHVEYDTQPHLIRAKRAGALTIPTLAGMTLRKQVRHPGTTGAHMAARGLADLAGSWQRDVGRMWRESARSIWRER
jgi:hypothetical protein